MPEALQTASQLVGKELQATELRENQQLLRVIFLDGEISYGLAVNRVAPIEVGFFPSDTEHIKDISAQV